MWQPAGNDADRTGRNDGGFTTHAHRALSGDDVQDFVQVGVGMLPDGVVKLQ